MLRKLHHLVLGSLLLAASQAAENSLPRTEVDGIRDEASRFEAPGDHTNISRQTIQDSAQPSVAELLRIEAGLATPSFFGNAGSGVPVIRGFAENASARTLILVDGLPVNRPDLSAPAWFEFPLAGLERIEVSRGSRTVRYGSAALAGVIALETRRHTSKPEFDLETAFGSDGTQILRSRLALPLKHDWQVNLSAESQQSDGWRDHSGFEAESLQLSLSGPQDRRLSQRYLLSYSDYEFENPGGLTRSRYRSNPRQSLFEVFGVEDDYRNRSRSLRLANQLEWSIDPNLSYQQNLSWLHLDRNLNFGAGSHTDQEIDTFNLESVLAQSTGNLELEWGIRAQFDDFRLQRFTDRQRRSAFAHANLERTAFGAFAIGTWQLSEAWKVSSGGSWDHFRLQAESRDSLSPSQSFDGSVNHDGFGFESSVEFTPNDDWSLWMRYDRVFRFPVLDEIAGYQGFVLSSPFNADLDPEQGNAIELGTRYQADQWTVGSTVFWQSLENEILFDFASNENRNFGETRRYGIESFLQYQADHWQAQLRHSFTRAEFAAGPFDGNRLPLVAEHSLTASVQWQPIEPLNFQLEADFLGSCPEGNDFANRAEFMPERLLFNGLIRWQCHPQCSLYLRVNNLFDQRYAALKYSGQWYPGAGRQLITGLQFNF